MTNIQIENFIRDIPDFPKKGIIFKDITPLLSNPEATKKAVDSFRLYKGVLEEYNKQIRRGGGL